MQKITTFLWFDNKAEEVAEFYCGLFMNSRIVSASPMMVVFELAGQKYMALNGGPKFKFNEAISLFVECKSQEEVDRFWFSLIADGGSESMCGWLKDKYGLSWQIVPKRLMDLLGDPDRDKAERVMQAMLGMRKIDIQGLEAAAAAA